MDKLAQATSILERFVNNDKPRIITLFTCEICAICGTETTTGEHKSWCASGEIARALELLKECADEKH